MAHMQEQIELTTTAHWKAVAHPLRVSILGLLTEAAQTNEELARALNVESGKLYFHTRRLLEAGLIEMVETRQKGPITEKLYRAVARAFTTAAPEKGGDAPTFDTMLTAALELYRATWRESGGLADETELAFHLVLPHRPKRRREFVERLRRLCDDFQKEASPDAPNARPLAISVLLHGIPPPVPGAPPEPEEKTS